MTKGARKSYSPESKAQAILELLKEQTSLSERASVYEVHPTLLTRWRKEALANLPKIFEDPRRKGQDEKDSLIKDFYSQVGRLTMELEWLGKNGVAPLPRRERVTLLDRGEDSLLSLAAQADLPGLNRSGLYDKPRSPVFVNIVVAQESCMHQVDIPSSGDSFSIVQPGSFSAFSSLPDLSGLRKTGPIGSHRRVLPLQRSGWADRAFS